MSILINNTPHWIRMLTSLTHYMNTFYRASCIILYSYQQIHNYFSNCHTPTCFDTIVSCSGSF